VALIPSRVVKVPAELGGEVVKGYWVAFGSGVRSSVTLRVQSPPLSAVTVAMLVPFIRTLTLCFAVK
jgi:hypothetical protein